MTDSATIDGTGAPKVIEPLSDGEAYLYAILKDMSGLDQAEFLWFDPSSEDNKFCRECGSSITSSHFTEHELEEDDDNQWVDKYVSPSGCFRAWPYQWSWWRTDDTLQIDQCVAGGQLVQTALGLVAIEDVTIGDYVLTHLGRWRMVTDVMDRGEREVVNVVAQGHHGLKVTLDHRLLARRSRRGTVREHGHKGKVLQSPEWMTSAEWEWNDGSGQMVTNVATSPIHVDPLDPPAQMERTYVAGRANLVDDFMQDEWLWLFGLYLAEGSTFVSSKDLTHRVVWSVHPTEADLVCSKFDAVGLNYWRDERGLVTCISVTSRPVVEWLRAHGGHLAHGKSIASWIFGLPEKNRRQVFEGMVFGDGHTRPTGRIEYTTVSRALAYGMKILAASLGYGVSIRVTPEREALIEGRRVHCQARYELGLQRLEGQTRPRCVAEGGTLWAPVTAIEPAGLAHVYDLEVDEDQSFVVEGVSVHNCARSVGKSLSIKVRGCAFPFVMPGQEMVITAPELVHLEPITGLIESQVYATRLLREMIPRTRSAVTHRPFQLNFSNGARIVGRIPQRDGKGVKGIHPIWLELDEAQDYPEPGWTELTETLKRGQEGAQWRAHGVTRGVRDKFYEYTQETPDNMWKVHRFPAMYRPNWSHREREQKEAEYGGRMDPDYRRNVLGLHGDNTNPIFVLAQLMSCCDQDSSSDYNTLEYFHPGWGRTKRTPAIVSIENLRLYDLDITEVLDYPRKHLQYRGVDKRNPGAHFWVGMDVGFTTDPTELLVFVEFWPHGPSKPSKIKLIARSSLVRMPHHEQIKAMLHTIHFYRPRAFGVDKGGHGLPLFMEIQEYLDAFRTKDLDKIPPWMHDFDLEFAVQIIKGYNFSEKLIVDFDKSVTVGDFDDPVAKSGMKRNAKEYATDVLRDLVDASRLELPWDPHLLTQYSGATQQAAKGSTDQYGRRLFCVDEETECLTQRGWTRGADLCADDRLWTMNPSTWAMEWNPLEAVNFFDGPHEVVEMTNRTHSSVTTPDHRWLVERDRPWKNDSVREWRTTDTLRGRISLPRLGSSSVLPLQSPYTDSFVELIAWAWTEGHFDRRHRSLRITQSATMNPTYVDRIRACLQHETGYWSERRDGDMAVFNLSKPMAARLLDLFGIVDWDGHGDQDKVVTSAFLMALTQSQLNLFIDTCVDADGCVGDAVVFPQKRENRVRAFEMACALAGRPTHSHNYHINTGRYAGWDGWHCTLLTTKSWSVQQMLKGAGEGRIERYVIGGRVWCPTVANQTWVARRNGSVYVTGNSKGNDHTLDASRFMALAWSQYSIEALLNQPQEQEAVLDRAVW